MFPCLSQASILHVVDDQAGLRAGGAANPNVWSGNWIGRGLHMVALAVSEVAHYF